jgi:AraC-like DNA-binding protein
MLNWAIALSVRPIGADSLCKRTATRRDLSIADVALAVGFSDASQLNRVFQEFVGVTPTAFRRETGVDK